MANKKDYDWLDDPFNDRKDQKPQTGCSGFAIGAIILVFVLVIALGYFIIGSFGALAEIFAA